MARTTRKDPGISTTQIDVDLSAPDLNGNYRLPTPRRHRGPDTSGAVTGVNRRKNGGKSQ